MGTFTIKITQELLSVVPEFAEHNYREGDTVMVTGQTYVPSESEGALIQDASADVGPRPDDRNHTKGH